MATTFPIRHVTSPAAPASEAQTLRSTYTTLRILFGAVPIIAGADKFTNFLANWQAYLNPMALDIVPVTAATFMHIVGVIEIAAGVLVLARPRIGSLVVMGWLLAIAAQLLVWGQYLDVAVRDTVIAIGGAWTLWRLSRIADHGDAPHQS